jgi:hypothetical protein
MIPGLRIDTSAKPVHKTSLTSAQIANLKHEVEMVDPDDGMKEQYEQINTIVSQMVGKFENEYDSMEISMVQTTLDAILNRGKRGSKPYELLNVISKVLDRVTVTGGRRRKTRKTRKRKTRKV